MINYIRSVFVSLQGVFLLYCMVYLLTFFALCPSPIPSGIWQVGDVQSLIPGQQIPLEDQRLSEPKDV